MAEAEQEFAVLCFSWGFGTWTESRTQSYHKELCVWLGTTLNDKQYIIVIIVVIMVKFMLTGGDNGKCSPLYLKCQHWCFPHWCHILLSLGTILADLCLPQTSLVDGTGGADDLPFLLPCMLGDPWFIINVSYDWRWAHTSLVWHSNQVALAIASSHLCPLAILLPFSAMGKCALLWFGCGAEVRGRALIDFVSAQEWWHWFPAWSPLWALSSPQKGTPPSPWPHLESKACS